jgi:FAD-dependent urate hydroxylase
LANAPRTDTVIIGAGPFGLSVAAHLRAVGTDFRIFGRPLDRWLNKMPVGMYLKSEGQASSLSDPSGRHTIGEYCAEHNIPYDDRAMPVAIETFTDYALSFQRELVPGVEEVMVSRVEASGDGFGLTLENGSALRAKRVIVATGLEHSEYVPLVFRGLDPSLISHSSEHRDLSCFRGKDVTVIGAGQSALETAALLNEIGAAVRVLVRRPELQWNAPPRLGKRPLYHRLRYPLSGLGEGLQLYIYSVVPQLFHHLPQQTRISKVKTVLDAAGAYWLRSRVEGKINIVTDSVITKAVERNGRLSLKLSGMEKDVTTDHVIAATGYRYDVRRLPFLSESIKERLRTEDHRPVLSGGYESTVPGMYFTGVASAYRFGPSMRFIDGVGYTARTICNYVHADRKHYAAARARSIAAPSSI